jgi:hypothetical protein
MPKELTVWYCYKCDYARLEKTTGVHQTSDPSGGMVVHELTPIVYTALRPVREAAS